MKKLLILLMSLLIVFTVASPCFCDEYNGTVYVNIPDLTDVVNEFDYTGEEITFEIPDSDYYIVSGNVRTEVGVYDAVVSLSNRRYVWSNGSTSDLFFSFEIKKVDYDLSNIEFNDEIIIADGKEHSLYVSNLPDSIDVMYSAENIVEPGRYTIIAVLIGDENHNQLDQLTATLIILEKPNEETKLYLSLGTVSGYIPLQTELSLNFLGEQSKDYKEIYGVLANKVALSDILDIAESKYTYEGKDIEYHEQVTYNIANPETEKVDVYAINTDSQGNKSYSKLRTKINRNILTFTTDISSDLVFVRRKVNYVLYIGIGVASIGFIALIVLLITKAAKKHKDKQPKKYRKLGGRKNKKTSKTSLYKKSGE